MEGFQRIAGQFINTTRNHLFLTGKAGTGKTTFLKNLPNITHKTFIVVAPTGIAALNAGGVTIHSQFLLPFGTFIPDRYASDNISGSQPFYTQNTLARKHPLNSSRKQVLRSIDLLVIDEVSMMRADLLDAIDYRLKAVRGNFQESFGGVQVLFIGDLYQLPPVVKREDEVLLGPYYKTPWFYEAKALENVPLVFIELDRIYRQLDGGFIDLLNNLRNNVVTQEDIDILNAHHRTPEEIQAMQEVITLTTHNYKADEINSKMLRSLSSPSCFFDATIEGEFPDNLFPLPQRLELKAGAQVMFTRNDGDGQYFNGKLATVKEISGSDVWVEMASTHVRYRLKRERWENKRYSLDDQRDLNEEIVGSFEQFPVKLAWAITVHKSQGLTFDKAIIDVAGAFADGQVYVALSRLRSLDGLVLRTTIKSGVISTDKNIASFVENKHRPDHLERMMKEGQQEFLRSMLEKTFDISAIVRDLHFVIKANSDGVVKDEIGKTLGAVAEAMEAERVTTEKFRRQLGMLLSSDQVQLEERIQKGSQYYHEFLTRQLRILLHHQEEMRQHKRVKTYVGQLTELDVLLTKKIKEVDKALVLTRCILRGEENFHDDLMAEQRAAERASILRETSDRRPEIPLKKKRKGKKKRVDEPDTCTITINLLKQGLSVKEIAETRGLVPATIEGHLAKAVEARVLPISYFVKDETVREISDAVASLPADFAISALHKHFRGRYSYGLLKAVLNHRGIEMEGHAS